MKYYTSRVIVDELVFPECPRWKNDSLWFSNIYADQLISMTADGKINDIFHVPSIGIDWLPDGRLIYIELRFKNQKVMQLQDGITEVYSDYISKLSPFLFNDLVINSNGFMYTGNTGCNVQQREEWGNLSPAPLVLIRPDGSGLVAAENMLCPNGMVITPDGKRLIVAETGAHRLTSFVINEDGTLSDRTIFAQFDKLHPPDGICLDQEGGVWVAAGAECIRVTKDGEISHTVKCTGELALACMLGGDNRQTLFICTKDMSLSYGEDFRKTKTGRIEVVDVDSQPGAGFP